MQYILNRFKNFTRIFVSILVIILLVSALFLVFNSIKSNENTKTTISLLEHSTIEKTNADFVSTINQTAMVNSALYTFIQSNMLELGQTNSENYYSVYNNVRNQIQLCTAMYNYIYSVEIVTPDVEISSGSSITYSAENKTLLGKQGYCLIYSVFSENRPFFLVESTNLQGINITITIDSYFIGKQIFYEYTPSQIKVITNKDGVILSSNRMEYLNKNISDFYNVKVSDNSYSTMYLENQKIFFSSENIDNYELYSLMFTNNEIYQNYNSLFSAKTIIFFLISFLMLTSIGILISFFVYKPIDNLMKITSKYFPIPLIKNIDELKYIQQIIIKQHYEKAELSTNIQRSISALRQQEVLSLQAQISPHYIANMLDAINWIAIRKFNGPNEISYCTEKTAYLFRYGMNLSSSFDTLKNELEIAKSTLEILKIRYKLNIDLICNIPDEIYQLKVIKVFLQPFIENAVIHGFANYKTDGVITITAKATEEHIEISIADNGKGISTEETENLQKKISDFSNMRESHIGLWNVNYRTQLIFGEKYTLKIRSEENIGTTFTMVFPIVHL